MMKTLTPEIINEIREVHEKAVLEHPHNAGWGWYDVGTNTQLIDNNEKTVALLPHGEADLRIYLSQTPRYIEALLAHVEDQCQEINRLNEQIEIARQPRTVNMPLVLKLTKAINLCMVGDTHRVRDHNTMHAAALLAEVVMALITPANPPAQDIDDIPF